MSSTRTRAHLIHHTHVWFVSPSQVKLLHLRCLVSIDLTAERATIGCLKIMFQAAGLGASGCTQQTLTGHY